MTHVQPALFGAPQTQLTSDDYYTPAWVFERMGLEFDIDVCAPPGGIPWIPAKRYFTMDDDGLAQEWTGRVWMNPPYSAPRQWIERFRAHRNGVCLVQTSKSTWFYELWNDADGIAFHSETVPFVGGQVFMPVCFAAFGPECVEAISRIGVVRVAA